MQAYQRSTAPGTITESGARNFQKSGTKVVKKRRQNKHSETRNDAFYSTGDVRRTETVIAREFFAAHPTEVFSRADIAERLNLPINHVTRLVYDLLDERFVEPAGRVLNPKSGKSVEAVRLAPPPVMVVREQSLFD